MPKISRQRHTLKVNGVSTDLNFDVFYNQKHGFYVKIDTKYLQTCDNLKLDFSDNWLGLGQKSSYVIRKERDGHSVSSKVIGYIVEAGNENNCILYAKEFYRMILAAEVSERKVIAVYYREDTGTFNSMRFNKTHEKIGFSVGLMYCIEKSVAGGNPTYFEAYESPFKDREIDYREIYLSSCTVVDDTPENRATLEKLYSTLYTLKSNLDNFLTSEDSIKELVSNNVKLIG